MAQTCYFPNGSKAPGKYKPCSSSNTTYSTCCSSDQNDRCLLNGLCSWTDHYDYQAACTSKDWTGCQRVCPLRWWPALKCRRGLANNFIRKEQHLGPGQRVCVK